MENNLTLAASTRELKGKGASRRLRRLENRVPAIVYGHSESQPISISSKELLKLQEKEAFYSSILNLDIDGKIEPVIVKDLQRHPAKNIILHADFQRVDTTTNINVYVPLHFINEEQCIGVKVEGGNISHLKTSIEIQCLPSELPGYIEVDMTQMKTGDILHISDIPLPENVASTALSHDHDLAIAQINAPKRAEESEEVSEDSPADASE
jgi:large subunit ribosomal protein L25